MDESYKKSSQLSDYRQSIQSNQQSVIPQQFQVITHLPVFICQFEQFEKRKVFQKIQANQIGFSQNEKFFDKFIGRRKTTNYYKRLQEAKDEAEILNQKQILQDVDTLLQQYLKIGHEDQNILQNIEDKLNRKSNQKKMQNFLRLSSSKKNKFNITQESNLSNSQHCKNFEEDPEIERSFFNKQDNVSQFQSLTNLIPKSQYFEDDFFSRTDQNYRKKFNDESKKTSRQPTQEIQTNLIIDYNTNEFSSNQDKKNEKFDKIIKQQHQSKIKLNPVNFAFQNQNSNSDNQSNNNLNSDNTEKRTIENQSNQEQIRDSDQSSINKSGNNIDFAISNTKNININEAEINDSDSKGSEDSESSNEFFDQKFDFDIKYDKQKLKEKGIDSKEFQAVMDSLTLVNEMKELKKHIKKIEKEDALFNKEIENEKQKIQELYDARNKLSNSLQESFDNSHDSIINTEGKKKNNIYDEYNDIEKDEDDDANSISEQMSVQIQSQQNDSQSDSQMIEVNIYDSQENNTKLQVPVQQFKLKNDGSQNNIIITADLSDIEKKKNHIWDKSSSEQNDYNLEDSQIQQKNISMVPVKKISDEKDTFTNSSASRYKRITQSQGKNNIKQQKESIGIDEGDEDNLQMSQLKIKSLKKFSSEFQNNLQRSAQQRDKNIYAEIYEKNSNEDLEHLRNISKKFNEVKPHRLEETQKQEEQQLFSFKQNLHQQVQQKPRQMMFQSDVHQLNNNNDKQYKTQTQIREQKENTQAIKMHLTLIKNKLKSKQPSKKKLDQSQRKRNQTYTKKQNSDISSITKNKSLSKDIKVSIQQSKDNIDLDEEIIKNKYDQSIEQDADLQAIDEVQEQKDINKQNKQFDYLKRKKKTYQIHKVKWNAKSKVNCWNKQKQKSHKKIKIDHDLEVNFNRVEAKVASLPKEVKKTKKKSQISYLNILETYENEFLPKFSQVAEQQDLKLKNTILPQIHLDNFQFGGDFYQIVLDDKKKYKKLLNFLDDQYDYILNNQRNNFYIYQNLFLNI